MDLTIFFFNNFEFFDQLNKDKSKYNKKTYFHLFMYFIYLI